MEVLSRFDFDDEYFRSLRETENYRLAGKGKDPELSFITQKSNYLFKLEENKIYTYFPLIFLGSAGFLFFLFIGIHRINDYLSTYITYFGHSLQRSNNGLVILDHQGRIIFFNENARRILGIQNLKMKEKFQVIFQNHSSFLNVISKSFENKNKLTEEISYSTPLKDFKGEVSITPFTSFLGFTYAYLMEIMDYTQPLLTDRGKVWGSTVQRIAHEIKTPLSTIQLNLKTLELHLNDERINDRSKYESDIALMKTEVNRIKELVKSFLKFTNLDKPKLQSIDLNKILYESLKQFSSYTTKGIKIVWKLDENTKTAFGDENQLLQLFHLILENAIDAMNGNGKIEIITKLEENINSENNNDFIIVEFKDNGSGIPTEIIEKVFEPYFTTKKDGTGIGLALAKKIVEDHEGKIEIESELNKGTTVKIILRG